MTDAFVGYAWAADLRTPAQRAVLGTLALHAGADGRGCGTVETLAQGSVMSLNSCRSRLHELVAAGWLGWTPQRSADRRRNGSAQFVLSGRFWNRTNISQTPNLSGSNLEPDTPAKLTSIRFDPARVNPAWAWRVDVPTASHRVVLATMALLSDHRGVCLAPRATIAERSLLSPASTNRVLNDLEQASWIGREARRRGARAAEARLHLTRAFLETAAPLYDDELPAPAGPGCDPAQDALLAPGGLAALICAARASSWRGPAANELATALTEAIAGDGRWVALRRVDFSRQDAIADTTSIAWLAVMENADRIMAATNPWGFLLSIIGRQAAKQDQLNRGVIVTDEGKVNAFTVTDEDWRLDQAEPAVDQDLRGSDVGLDDLADSPMMQAIVTQLATIGVDPGLAWPVLCRCAEIAVKEPASRRHTAARRDRYLAILGLSPDAASAWMNIITGTRRTGQQASPLLTHPESILDAVPAKWLDAILSAA